MSTATLPIAPAPSALAPSVSDRTRLAFAVLAGTFAAELRGIHHQFHLGTLFMDPYWVNFYLTGYQDGFRRRALVGTLIRMLSPHAADVRWLNLLAAITVCALLAIFCRAFLTACASGSPLSRLFAFALCASAFVSVAFEVFGDTLQLAIVVFLGVALALRRLRPRPLLKAAALAGAMGVAFLIHEASIFLLAPCIPFILRRSPRLRDFALPTLAALALFAISARWSSVDAHLTYAVHLYPQSKPALTEAAGTPSFNTLMQTEYAWDFGTRGNVLRFAERCFGIGLMIFASLVGLAHCIRRGALERILHILVAMCFFSAPLWMIAHDWGRFMTYNLLLAVTLGQFHRPIEPTQPTRRIADRLITISRCEPIQLATILLLIASPFVHNRDLVLAPAVMQSCAGILFFAAIAHATRIFAMSTAVATAPAR